MKPVDWGSIDDVATRYLLDPRDDENIRGNGKK